MTNNNFTLIKPADGSTEWGLKLNNNFELIEQKFEELSNKTSNSLVCAGLYKDVEISFQNSDTNLFIGNIYGYFPGIATNGGLIEQGSVQFRVPKTIQDNKYYTYNLIIQAEVEQDIFKLNGEMLETIPADLFNDTTRIFIGQGVVCNGKWMPQVTSITPWQASYTLKDRIENFNKLGTIQGLTFTVEKVGNDFTIKPNNTENYYWYLEGVSQNNVAATFLSDSPSFFVAYADKEKKEDLDLHTTFAPKYFNNEPIDSNKYVIYRLGLTKNLQIVLLYGDKEYETLEEAKLEISKMPDINTNIYTKEISRLVVKKNEEPYVLNFYKNENDSIETQSIGSFIDTQKNGYVFADAAEIRSSGVIPGKTVLTTRKENNNIILTLQGPVCFVQNGIIDYVEANITHTFGFDTAQNTIYKVLYRKNNSIQLVALTQNEIPTDCIFLGFLSVYSTTSQSYMEFIDCPYVYTTKPAERIKNNYNNLLVQGGNMSQDFRFVNETVIFGEGINNLMGYKTIDTSSTLEAQVLNMSGPYLSNRKSSSLIIEDKNGNVPTANQYLIHKFLLGANGQLLYILGDKIHIDNKPDLYDDSYTLSNNFAIEVCRIITKGSNVEEIYYTNQKFLNNIALNYINGTDADLKNNTDFKELSSVVNTHDAQIGQNTTAIDNLTAEDVQLDAKITTNTNNIEQLNNKVNNLEQSIIKVLLPEEEVPSALTQYILIKDGQIYIWDGIKYQLMNSWQ